MCMLLKPTEVFLVILYMFSDKKFVFNIYKHPIGLGFNCKLYLTVRIEHL